MSPAVVLASIAVALGGAQAPTSLHVFSPWEGSIPARGVTIAKTLKGSCTHGSQLLTRFDAWRCYVGRRAYDPCFANTRAEVGAHVLCMSSPWEAATAIELAKPLPLELANPSGDPKRFSPWAMVTAAHQQCELVTGSLGRIDGRRINYACAGSGVLVDLPTRGRTWTQQYADTVKARTTRPVALREVWW
jgi:hypothetical protein